MKDSKLHFSVVLFVKEIFPKENFRNFVPWRSLWGGEVLKRACGDLTKFSRDEQVLFLPNSR